MKVRDWNAAARYGLPGLILGAATAWLGGARAPELSAQTGGEAPPVRATAPRTVGPGPAATSAAGGVIALLGSTSGPAGNQQTPLLFLVDPAAKALAVYKYDPNSPKGSLKLEAARRYEWDLKLEQYNNQAPEPGAIEASLNAARPERAPKDR